VLNAIVGSRTREKILTYLVEHGDGYARAMAAELGCALDTVQKQLKRLDKGGVVKNRTLGRTRVYSFDPDYPLLRELLALLEAARQTVRSSDSALDRPTRSNSQSRYIVRRIV
jgi:DNA-binding transcriptional ArsR family regulator